MQFSAIYGEASNLFDSQSTSRVKLWVNAAYHDILARRTWSFLEASKDFTLVADQGNYVLAGTSPILTDFGGLISVSVSVGTGTYATVVDKLFYLDQQMFARVAGPAPGNNGVPRFYTLEGALPATSSATVVAGGQQQMRVWPLPNDALSGTIRYFRAADSVELSADTDVPLLPVRHHFTLILKAIAFGLLAEDQMLQANMYDQQAEKRIQEMIADDQKRVMDNERLTIADQPEIQGRVNATPATYAPDQRTYPSPDVD